MKTANSKIIKRIRKDGKTIKSNASGIAEHKKNEGGLKGESFLKNVIDSFAYPFYVTGNNYKINLVNRAAREKGINMGDYCYKVTHNRKSPCKGEHNCPLREVFTLKKPVIMEHIHYDKNGKKRCMNVHGDPIFNDKGEVIQMIEYSIDVTEIKNTGEKLKESETKFKELFDNMHSGVAIYKATKNGNDFIFSDFNKAAEKIDKIKKEEIIGKSVLKEFPGVKKFGLFDVFNRVYKTGKAELFPASFYKDGRIEGWRENFVYKLPSEEIVSVYDDITGRKKVEENLNSSKEMLQRIIDILPIRVFWKDENLRYLGCNEIFAKDAGKNRPEDLIGKDDFEMGWKEQAKSYREDDLEVIKSGKSKLNFEELQTTPKGDTIWLKTSKLPLSDLQRNSVGILGTYDDITERKKSEEEYKNIVHGSIDGFWIIDLKGHFLEVNDTYCYLMGYSHDELLKMEISDIEAKEKPVDIKKRIQEILKNGKAKFETRHKCKDGKILDFDVSVSYIKESEKLFVFLRDITERKKSEEQLNKLNESLRIKIEDLEKFNKLSVGRELRMIELKNKIADLEQKLKGQMEK
ncbi:MAG: PAS domain S-box protein [archaeon]